LRNNILDNLYNHSAPSNKFIDSIVHKIKKKVKEYEMALLDTIEDDFSNYKSIDELRDEFPLVYEILDRYIKLNEYEKLMLKDNMDYYDIPGKLVKMNPNDDMDFHLIGLYEDYTAGKYDDDYCDPRGYVEKVGNDYFKNVFDSSSLSGVSRTELFNLPTVEKALQEWYIYK
jgi:hypothetical protein